MKIALFSDIHANLSAFEAVLRDMDQQKVDQLYCLGDLVGYAPFPNEVIEEIRRRRIPTIAGNHDEAIGMSTADDGLRYRLTEEMSNGAISAALTNQLISPDNRAYLKNLPRHMRIDFKLGAEDIRLLLVHGSPRKINEYLFEAHDESDLLHLLMENQAHIMAFGHTHRPFHRALKDGDGLYRHAINIGSVGKPKDGDPRACYVLLELDESSTLKKADGIHIRFIRVAYEIEQTAVAIEQGQFPNDYAEMLRQAF